MNPRAARISRAAPRVGPAPVARTAPIALAARTSPVPAVPGVLRRLRTEEDGGAIVEFLGVSLVLLLPLVYLVLTLGQVQAAAFAAEAAARESGRVLSQGHDLPTSLNRAHHAVRLAFEDHGIVVDPAAALSVDCEHDPCLTPGGQLHIEVTAVVGLPLVPSFLGDTLPLEVPVQAAHLAVVPEFRSPP